MLLDLDPASLREWVAAVGLLRLVTETTHAGRLAWRLDAGRYRLVVDDVPDDLARRCADWISVNRGAWHFAGRQNVDFDAAFWRTHALGATGVETALWCALASDAVWHRDGKKLKASGLEYAHGGGHQHWLASLRGFLADSAVTAEQFARMLANRRDEEMEGCICRWDPACERDHALRAKAPTRDPMAQDQTINALAAIGLASCPSAPGERQLVTPLVAAQGRLAWPIWTAPLRLADLEAALCCGWSWPTMEARRWLSGKLYCFSRGELREPKASRESAEVRAA
jgi:hypothetical protein